MSVSVLRQCKFHLSLTSVCLSFIFGLIFSLLFKATGGNSAVAHKSGSLSTPATSTGQAGDNKSLVVHSVVPRDSDIGKDSSDSGKESITFSKSLC